MRMIDSGAFKDKRILLIEKEQKNQNDRTWCFWEKGEGYFENIITKKWPGLKFCSDQLNIDLDISPYVYKMIRGIDFYTYCLQRISGYENIKWMRGEVRFVKNGKDVLVNGDLLNPGDAIVFSSIYDPSVITQKDHNLLQLFKGWIIECDIASFDPENATLMDFRADQSHGSTFVYVLPLTGKKALIEYTLFTNYPSPAIDYDAGLSSFISNELKLGPYKILEEETGQIPMTSHSFPVFNKGKFQIGIAGGRAKPSTGYTFRFIQKQADDIVQRLVQGKELLRKNSTSGRFSFYDNTLLHILSKNKVPGKQVFEKLFKSNKASSIFKFLDNESSPLEELAIINSLPKWEFFKAGISELLKRE